MTVLLIEDDKDYAELIRRWLSSQNEIEFVLNWAGSLKDGLNRLDQGGVDAILLDLGLPDSSGLKTFSTAKMHAPDVPIVVLSGAESEPLAVQTLQNGAQDYLIKSVCDSKLLVKALRYAVVRSGLQAVDRPPAAQRTTIGVLGAKGGVGATTFACNLAIELRRHTGAGVLLVDLDVNGGLVDFLMNAKAGFSILDLADSFHRLDRSLWDTLVTHGPGGVDVIPGPDALGAGNPDVEKIQQVLALIRTFYRWTVLDLGRVTGLSMGLLDKVDQLFLVTTVSVPALYQAKRASNALMSAGLGTDRLRLIAIDQTGVTQPVSLAEVGRLLGLPVYATLPDAARELENVWTTGELVGDCAYRRQVGALARKTTGVPEPTPPPGLGYADTFVGGQAARERQEDFTMTPLTRNTAAGADAIIERRRPAALLKTGALQNAIFNSANFSSIATDAKGVIQIFNVGAERMLGYTAIEVVNRITPADISDPEEVIARAKALSVELATPIRPGFEALVFKASRGIEDIYELTYIRKDGSRFPAVVSVTALRDAQGGIIGYLLIGTDNTARKQAEEALLKTGALQNAIFNSANFSSIATDAKGVIQIFNVGAERMLGYTAIEVVNRITPADISDPEEVIARAKALSVELATPIRPGFEALVFKASRGIEDIYELTYIRKDGSRFPAVVSVTALRDAQGGIIGYLLIGTDDTARKQVEAEQEITDQRLRDQQFYTRSLIESNVDAMMTTDLRGIITDVNKQTEALTGWTRDELIGAPFRNYFTDPGRAEAGIRRVLTENKVTDSELTARARDGRETAVSYNATTFYDRDRKLKGVIAAVRDVTERKRTDRMLQESNVEMERTRAAAEKANRAKSDFLSSMSHEIRTPMNAILGMADMLWETKLDAEQTRYVEVFRRAGASLLMLISDILDLSKIEAGHLDLDPVEFELEEAVNEAIQLTAVEARAKGLQLAVRLVPGLANVFVGDPARLRQILINLLGNAVKFTECGEVVLTVRNNESGRDGEIEFAVSDTGVGIATDKLETIFEDFTQLDASSTSKYGGTGLGLAISRRIVEAMGGRLTATSSPGKGSTFRFSARFTPAPERPRPVLGAIGDLIGRKVVVVDDNETNCLILRETLHAWGLESDMFRLPAEALVSLAEKMTGDEAYSLAIIDSCMPDMDGFELAAGIRRIAGNLPVLMLSSGAKPEKDTRRATGLSGYAVKPVSRAELLRLVCAAMAMGRVPETGMTESVDSAPKEPVKPARLLVAEDSPDNRLLIEVYLKGSPYQLVFEEDGGAAVDRFSNSDFDLIIMDVRMPVMDGLAATRAIRELERKSGAAAIPIIALTANASPEDIEKSRDAGCNAHLSKPISRPELLSTIEKYRRQPKPLETAQSGSPESIRIEMPAGLEDIVPGYLAGRKRDVSEMSDLLEASNFERLSILGHNLKGSARGYGFPGLDRIGAAIEAAANQMDCGSVRTSLTELGDYLDRVQLSKKT